MTEPDYAPLVLPAGGTARRLEWQHLPPHVRALVERRIGGTVVAATSQRDGFTPTFASVLTTDGGRRHFVKAASVRAQGRFAASLQEEARKLAALPADVPAPPLAWLHADDDWVVLAIGHVDARPVPLPWSPAHLDLALDTLADVAARLTPPPTGPALRTFAEEFADLPGLWPAVTADRSLPHAEDAAALAAGFAAVVGGDTVVHTDVRADNLLLEVVDGRERLWLCDWNWPVTGAAWLDSLTLLIAPRGDGLDVEATLATHPTFAGVPAEAVDAVLALLVGYFAKCGDDPAPSTSPYLRPFQRWQGEVLWHWLCERRGWEYRSLAEAWRIGPDLGG